MTVYYGNEQTLPGAAVMISQTVSRFGVVVIIIIIIIIILTAIEFSFGDSAQDPSKIKTIKNKYT